MWYSDSGSGYDPASQLASTASPDETVWTLFGRKTDGTAGWARWTGLAWGTGNAGKPPGADVGWSMAAAQGWLSGSTYGLHLWTPSTLIEPKGRVAV